MRQMNQDTGNLRSGQGIVHRNVCDGALRHADDDGILGILHDGNAALALDRVEASGSVVERAAKHDAHHTRTVPPCRCAKERVNCWARTVLAWAAHHTYLSIIQEEMVIGDGDVDATAVDGLAVAGGNGGQAPRMGEDAR
jgi:hypothetical protein